MAILSAAQVEEALRDYLNVLSMSRSSSESSSSDDYDVRIYSAIEKLHDVTKPGGPLHSMVEFKPKSCVNLDHGKQNVSLEIIGPVSSVFEVKYN